MLLKAVYFDAYSENMFKNIQKELEETICCMLSDLYYSEYKTFLKDIYECVIREEDISRCQPTVEIFYKKMTLKKLLKDVPVFAVCLSLSFFMIIIFKMSVIH